MECVNGPALMSVLEPPELSLKGCLLRVWAWHPCGLTGNSACEVERGGNHGAETSRIFNIRPMI